MKTKRVIFDICNKKIHWERSKQLSSWYWCLAGFSIQPESRWARAWLAGGVRGWGSSAGLVSLFPPLCSAVGLRAGEVLHFLVVVDSDLLIG